ncbi:MAG: amidohydrolase family protein [Proteobacteria bacterium]|nr:amidohydrolase family protein [Pseudomonadota bacterium]
MHDHHIHLFATAAALESAQCGPGEARDGAGLARALREHAPDARGWVRGVGYYESVAGEIERHTLDAVRDDVPIRMQHRSGQLWMLNSCAIALLDLDRDAQTPTGVERDGAGRATGRIYRCDEWLRTRLGPVAPPSLAEVSRRLTALGVTDVTDATPSNGAEEVAAFAAARASGELSQRVIVMGTLALSAVEPPPGIEIGPVKIHLAESALPELECVIETIRAAHARGRNAAIHCVTRVELVFALAAYEAAGIRVGDRLEHVHVAPPICVATIARLGLTVCANDGMVRSRCADWGRDLDLEDAAVLGRREVFEVAGIALLSGSDAPYGPLGDPVGSEPALL